MSKYPKIQVNDHELWLMTYYGKLMPKWECRLWTDLADVIGDAEQIVEVYLIKKRRECGLSSYIHEFIGYGCVNIRNYLQLKDEDILK